MRLSGHAFWAGLLLAAGSAAGQPTNPAPDFNEVYGLVRDHLTGVSPADLNQAAVEGLLSALRGKVKIVNAGAVPATNAPALATASLLESNVAYLRLAGLEPDVAAKFAEQLKSLGATNPLAGIVLDLRFADSEDYAAAGALADLFQTKPRALVDWGQGKVRATEKTNAIRLPVALLVNRDTGGAAEALAAVLRETGAALLIGNPTAGRAMIGEDFPLKDGRRLRVASVPVKVGDALKLGPEGVRPDILVNVTLAEERAFQGAPYGLATSSLTTATNAEGTAGITNRPARRTRTSEADLVRARRDGIPLEETTAESRTNEPAKPLIRDPALARAVDLIKGLAVIRAASF